MTKHMEKSRFYRFAFGILALLLLQWNLACTSKRQGNNGVGTDTNLPPADDPFGGGFGGDFDPTGGGSLGDDIFLPGFDDDDPTGGDTVASGNNCIATGMDGLGIGMPEGSEDPNVQAAVGCVDGNNDQALNALLLQSLGSFEHMRECVERSMAVLRGQPVLALAGGGLPVAPQNSGRPLTAAEKDLRFLTAQLGLVRCYRGIQNKITASLPWLLQARDQQAAGDRAFYGVIQQIIGSIRNNN